MKVVFIGDPHLNDVTPSSRRDDYSQSILDKFREIYKLVSPDDKIIIEGDLWHRTSGISLKYINKVVEVLKECPCEIYSIIGNHDIPYERLDEISGTPMGLCFKTGIVKHLKELELSDVFIQGVDYGQPIPDNIHPEKYSVLVAHKFYEDTLVGFVKEGEALTESDAMNLGYSSYVLGHDHSYHEPVNINSTTIYRHGSLSRGSSHTSNLERDIKVLMLDCNTKKFKEQVIQVKKAEDIYEPSVFRDKKSLENYRLDIQQSMESILENMNFSLGSSIYDVLDATPMANEVRELIERYLVANSILRKVQS